MIMEVYNGQIVRQQLDQLKVGKNIYLNPGDRKLKEKRDELIRIRNEVEQREQQFYKLFKGNIKNINDLNNFISTKIGSLVIFNNNSILDKLKLTDQNLDFSAIIKGLTPYVEKQFTKVIKNKALTDEEVQKAVRDMVIAEFNKTLKGSGLQTFVEDSSRGKSLGRVLSNFIVKEKKLTLKKDLDQYVSSATKDRLKNLLDLNGNIKTNGDKGVSVEVYNTIAEKNRQTFATWGSGKKIDQQQKEIMREELLQQLLSYLTTAEHKAAFTKAFYKVPLDSWFVSTKTAVAGILGEVQLGAILELIFKDPNVIQVGDLLNELNKNKKVSIDVILESCGFQVKNYNIYADTLKLKSEMKYFTLNESGDITKVSEKLDFDPLLVEILKTFFAIDAFNVQYDQKFEGIRKRIDITKDQYRNYLGAMGANKFLKFEQEIQGTLGKTSLTKGMYYNVFYYSNGKFFSSTQILDEIIKVIDNLLHAEPSNIVLKTSYSGITSEIAREKASFQNITSDQIAREITLNIHYMFTM